MGWGVGGVVVYMHDWTFVYSSFVLVEWFIGLLRFQNTVSECGLRIQ